MRGAGQRSCMACAQQLPTRPFTARLPCCGITSSCAPANHTLQPQPPGAKPAVQPPYPWPPAAALLRRCFVAMHADCDTSKVSGEMLALFRRVFEGGRMSADEFVQHIPSAADLLAMECLREDLKPDLVLELKRVCPTAVVTSSSGEAPAAVGSITDADRHKAILTQLVLLYIMMVTWADIRRGIPQHRRISAAPRPQVQPTSPTAPVMLCIIHQQPSAQLRMHYCTRLVPVAPDAHAGRPGGHARRNTRPLHLPHLSCPMPGGSPAAIVANLHAAACMHSCVRTHDGPAQHVHSCECDRPWLAQHEAAAWPGALAPRVTAVTSPPPRACTATRPLPWSCRVSKLYARMRACMLPVAMRHQVVQTSPPNQLSLA